MKYLVTAPIDAATPVECLPHIDGVTPEAKVHAVGCRCIFTPIDPKLARETAAAKLKQASTLCEQARALLDGVKLRRLASQAASLRNMTHDTANDCERLP